MTSRFTTISAAVALVACLSMATMARADIGAARKALTNDDYPAANEALDAVLEQRPDDPQAQFLKGLALARSGDADGARERFEQLVKEHPDMAEAWNNLGVLRARQSDLAAARDALQEAVRIDPQHGPAQENLGDVYAALARRAYARASELESGNAIVLAKRRQMTAFINDGGDGGSPATASGPDATEAEAAAGFDASTPEKAVAAWARAWSEQNVDVYLSMYGEDFEPAEATSRAAWKKERRERVSAPARIKVHLDDVRIERRGNQALARFDQRYESNLYEDSERKMLLLAHTGENWKIVREDKAGRVDFSQVNTAAPDRQAKASASAEETDQSTASDPESAPGTSDSAEPIDRDDETQGGRKASVGDLSAIRTHVRMALEKWAKAWSGQNVQGYLNAYSDNFEPARGRSIAQWVRERRERVSNPAWVRVELRGVEVAPLDKGRVRATFEQHYESSAREDTENKQVTLVHEDGGWRIIRES